MFSFSPHPLLNKPAPTDITLPNQDGEQVSLGSIIGKQLTIIFFYPKDESYGCTKEVCSFRDQYAVFKDAGAEVLGISSDSVEKHKRFAGAQKLQFPLLSDVGGQARKAFQVPTTLGLPGRATFLIDRDGIVRDVFNSMMNFEGHVKTSIEFITANSADK